MARQPHIVAITAGGPYPWVIINALGDEFGQITVIVEQAESKKAFLKRRIRHLGLVPVLGQAATMAWSKFGKTFARARENELIAQHGLRTEADAIHRTIAVPSANCAEAHGALRDATPDLVFTIGCRMLSKATLATIACPTLNYHAGITPKYRGMNGGYYARATGDEANFGTTVHRVDAGVDTGAVLHQTRIAVDGRDTILTYAMLMAAHSRALCVRAARDILDGTATPVTPDLPSMQWYHPPIWSYLWTGLTRGVW